MEAKIDELLSGLTLDEKIDMMHGRKGWHTATPFTYRLWTFGNRGCRRLGIPAFRFTDGPKGINVGRSTCFPVAIARGASFDPALEERVGAAMGLEARHQGANATGSTCINIIRHPGWGRSQETFGADTFHMATMGTAHVRGLKGSVMPVVKHFACNSIENTRFRVSVDIEEKPLREVYLPHFRACVDAGAAAVMSAYNRVNGVYCGENGHLLNDILKREWGFQGFVISDWFFGCRSTAPSIRGGLDIEMPLSRFFTKRKIRKALKSGEITEAMLDESVRRIIRQLMKFGMFEEFRPEPKKYVACDDHIALALESARKSIVLLKNNGILPLKRGRLGTIAVIGRDAAITALGDVASSAVKPPFAVTPLQGIRELAGESLRVVYGKSARAARGADAAIVVVSLSRGFRRLEGERIFPFGGGDRTVLELPEKEERLIRETARINGNCVVVIESGGAVCVDSWVGDVAALLMAWYPGMMGGRALAEVLFGDVNPGGRLPVSVPRSTSQLPPLDTVSDRVAYDSWHDYRYYDRCGLAPAYPFGFGLGYSTFEYLKISLDRDTITREGIADVRVVVKNVGEVPGDEVVQLYIGRGVPGAGNRAVRELRGFRRISAGPGEKRELSFTVRAADLAAYNVDAGLWEIEPGGYLVEAGGSSRNLPLSCTLSVA
ncbi:MAG: glycoside hydrolase family 3 C-terminal domain-containing protein [Spirochaetes bacterium]|nr:glycoside hydrolase family 3 C-terminal domain-containing protein [Spirochaetota bacterium]